MSYSSHLLINIAAVVVCWALTPLITTYADPPSNLPLVIARHCSDHCGNISIPYPFGIEEDCYFSDEHYSSFKINCNNSTTPPTPIFGTNYEIVNISVTDAELRSRVEVSYDCYNISGYNNSWTWNTFNLATFTISSTKNTFVAIGCDTYSWFTGFRQNKTYETGCMTKCVEREDVIDGECSGIGCCQAAIPTGVKNISVNVHSYNRHKSVHSFNPCSVSFPIAKDAFIFHKTNLSLTLPELRGSHRNKVPVVFNWAIGTENCSDASKAKDRFLCKENAECYDREDQVGYRCKCKQGFSGNPYLPDGCKDVDECKENKNITCQTQEYCVNGIGNYYCECPKGYHGKGTKDDHCISNENTSIKQLLVFAAFVGVAGAIIALLVIGFLLYWQHSKRQLVKKRRTYYEQNGGLILNELRKSRGIDTFEHFSIQVLEQASNSYGIENKIGQGGFSNVYKGILPNKQVVAIKKFHRVNPSPKDVKQFINEIIVLSQINNEYVVKLLGCCLNSEVPLLVYEFINNGTLYEHLNDEEKASLLKWPIRLKIASQVAKVLLYLHDTNSPPIIHMDMKSMNILLDESYTAKVTDFGASRLIPLDQSKFETVVLGTRGYLDPEYLQTHELTKKSDVYSFGVILVELLTRKKAFLDDRPEPEKSLAKYFILRMEEGCLRSIIDKSIVNEGTSDEDIQQVANLAKRCLMIKGEERPTMNEVALELDTIISKAAYPWNNGSMGEDHEFLIGGALRSDDCDGNSGIELSQIGIFSNAEVL